jgi:hypothetical protein
MRSKTGPHHYLRLLMPLLSFTIAKGAAALEARVIYRCMSDGVATFSDKPCGNDARAYQAGESRSARYTSAESTAVVARVEQPPARKKNRQQPTDANAKSKIANECRRLNEALRGVRQRMRAGYTVDAGERLKLRKLQIERRRRERRCR